MVVVISNQRYKEGVTRDACTPTRLCSARPPTTASKHQRDGAPAPWHPPRAALQAGIISPGPPHTTGLPVPQHADGRGAEHRSAVGKSVLPVEEREHFTVAGLHHLLFCMDS